MRLSKVHVLSRLSILMNLRNLVNCGHAILENLLGQTLPTTWVWGYTPTTIFSSSQCSSATPWSRYSNAYSRCLMCQLIRIILLSSWPYFGFIVRNLWFGWLFSMCLILIICNDLIKLCPSLRLVSLVWLFMLKMNPSCFLSNPYDLLSLVSVCLESSRSNFEIISLTISMLYLSPYLLRLFYLATLAPRLWLAISTYRQYLDISSSELCCTILKLRIFT